MNLQNSWYVEVTLYSCGCPIIGLWWGTIPNRAWTRVELVVIILVMLLPIIATHRNFFKLGKIWNNKSCSVLLNAKKNSLCRYLISSKIFHLIFSFLFQFYRLLPSLTNQNCMGPPRLNATQLQLFFLKLA